MQRLIDILITFSTYMTRSRPLFRDLKILDVYQLHRLSICSFMYDLIDNLQHSLPQYCSLIQHGYSTRQKEDENLYIHVVKVKTSLGKEFLSYLGTTFWNDLPIKIRKKPARSSFRKAVVELLLES